VARVPAGAGRGRLVLGGRVRRETRAGRESRAVLRRRPGRVAAVAASHGGARARHRHPSASGATDARVAKWRAVATPRWLCLLCSACS
jgi:hypothetical protein